MRTMTMEYKVYRFSELSEEAQEKVKDWYLDVCRDTDDFSNWCEEYLLEKFPHSELKVQYSLGYCQGDGLNIYGRLDLEDAYNLIKGIFTEKEQKFFAHVFREFSSYFKMEQNNRYCYCICDRYDYTEDIVFDMEISCYRNIRYDLLEKFNKEVGDYLCDICSNFEQDGYNWFYEANMSDIEDFCEANDYEFLEDGTLF